jgi:RNA polymerase sigma factor for flagellar operon FliA
MKNLGAYNKAQKRDLTRQEKNDLIEKYAPLVKITAYRLIARLPAQHYVEDLISCGMIGLLEAIESFDPSFMIKLETFAKFRIRGAMIDEMRQRDWIPRSVRSKIRELDQLYRKLAVDLQRVPDDQDMAAALELNLEDYYNLIVNIQPAGMISYDDVASSEHSDRHILDFLEDKSVSHPDFEMQMKELKSSIISALEHLEEDEQLVTSLYYYEGLTLKEIAQVLSVSESRISQIHAKALTKLNWRLDRFRKSIPNQEG